MDLSCHVANFQVARELEDPWRFEPNEIPVGALQHDFNERLLRIADVALLDLPFRSLQVRPRGAACHWPHWVADQGHPFYIIARHIRMMPA
jgi:hypothetical protein